CAPLLPAIHRLQPTFLRIRALRILPAWMEVRRAGFDCVVDFSRNDRSAWLTFLSGAPRRIVSDRVKIKSRIRARFYNEFVDCAMKQMHTADYYLALLQPLGISTAANDPMLELPPATEQRASSIIADQIHHQPFAIFHPGWARVLVTVDSAPMHLASAAGTPQVILFGPTNPFHWRPRKSPAAILFGESPEPLHNFQSREAKRPMKQISTAAVINAMRLMVSAP